MYIASSIKQEPNGKRITEYIDQSGRAFGILQENGARRPATVENAKSFLEEQLFDQRHYDLERVGRYKLNQKLDLTEYIPNNHRNVTKWDIVRLVRHLIMIDNDMIEKDDIDHLGNRRVKTVGELISNKLRIGLRSMEGYQRKNVYPDQEGLTVSQVNIRRCGCFA